MKSRSHDDATVESFRQDPELAAAYLNDVLVEGDQEELMIALRRVSCAFGGVGYPDLRSLTAILRVTGLLRDGHSIPSHLTI